MKRYIAGLACAATAVLGVPALASTAHAQAAADPVAALKKQLRSGHGVKYSDITKVQSADIRQVLGDRQGTLQFGASGISASDQTTKLRIKASDIEALVGDSEDEKAKGLRGLAKPERVVRIGNTTYISGGFFGEYLPEGKTWLRLPGANLGILGTTGQPINPAEPATLKALLAHAVTKRPGSYSGKITQGELYKVSPWYRATAIYKPSGKAAKSVLNWKLFVGGDQLPQRLTTTYSRGGRDNIVTIDTRYSGWGSPVSVKAPPADQVAKPNELGEGADTSTMPIPLLNN
ncbi:hypothetical protein [Streptosporangium carneum]|uniref:LppX_LprAFG lipoprotein n=1 Tax=Streptosporangium carneum TaxID=47481 RepID=A0A9W6I4J6_9ACTN|nr:hypothetical protein [Streptosporangium carneum]GLK11955.1 hypothetical protein GCM10017600_53630 [Streptosporangium carneum]